MKREYIAVLLIAAIMTLALINIRHIENKTLTLTSDIELAENLYINGDKAGAVDGIEASLDSWLHWDSYSHIMLRHNEIDIITDAYYELLTELEGESKAPSASFDRLKEELRSVIVKERVTLGSIL